MAHLGPVLRQKSSENTCTFGPNRKAILISENYNYFFKKEPTTGDVIRTLTIGLGSILSTKRPVSNFRRPLISRERRLLVSPGLSVPHVSAGISLERFSCNWMLGLV